MATTCEQQARYYQQTFQFFKNRHQVILSLENEGLLSFILFNILSINIFDLTWCWISIYKEIL